MKYSSFSGKKFVFCCFLKCHVLFDHVHFSDFWHQGSFLWLLKTDEAGFLKKKILGQKWRKRCEEYTFLSISWQPEHRFF